jgi:hypothetical protein
MKKIKKNKLEKYQNSGPVKDQSFIPSINNIFQQGLGIAPNITNPGGNPFGTSIFGDQLTKGIFDTGQLFKGTQQLNQLETPLGAWGGDVSKGIENDVLNTYAKKYGTTGWKKTAEAWARETGQDPREFEKLIQDEAGQQYDNTIAAQKTWNEYGKPLAANMAAMEKFTDMQAVEGLKGNKNALYRVDDEVKGMESKGIFQMGGAPQISALQQALGYKDNSPFKNLPSQTILRNMSADGVNITMDGVSKNLYLIPDKGRPVLAQGNSGEYYFPNANAVEEIPAMQDGGAPKAQNGLTTKVSTWLNPKNWFVDDYSDRKEFVDAFNSARADGEKLEYVKKLKGYVEKYGFESLAESDPKGAMFLQEQLELLSKGGTDPKDPPIVGGNVAEGEDIVITAKRKREGSNGEIAALPSVRERLMNPVQLEKNDDLFKEILEGFKEQKPAAQREQEYKRKLQLMFAEQQRKNQQEDSNIYTGRGRYAKEGGTIQNFQNSGSPIINPNQATRQDSINVINAAKAVDAYYASLMKKGWYSKKDVLKIPTSLTQNEFKKSMDRVKEHSISTYENDIESARILGEPDMYYRNMYPKRDLSQYLSEVEKSMSDTKKGSGTKYYYKDLLPSIIDPVAPSTLIDTRIKPQFIVEYRAKYPRDRKRSPVGGSVTALYTYDPIATTPVDLLTPSELKRRQELYPDSFGAKPSIKTNKKPFKKEIPPSPRDLVEIDPLQQQELRQLDIPQRQVDMSNVEHTDYESGEMVKPYEGVPNVNVVFKKRKSDGRLVPFAYENSEGERIGYNETLTKKFQYPGKFQSGGIPILNLSKNINPMRLNPQGIYKMGGLITEDSEYNKRKQPKKNPISGASSTGPMGPKDIPSYDGGIRAIIDQEKDEIIPTENLIPIQAEKGELIVLPTGDVVPVMAKKRHHQMDEDEVTDVAPEGAYILSSFGRVKIKKKEAENVIAETGVKPYKLGIGQETPTEKTLGDIMTKKEMAPAEVGKLISRRFPVIATDNPYEAAANTENKINRRPYLEGLIQLSEFDKMRKGIDTSTPEATREYRDEEEEMYEYEGGENEVEEMMQGGNPMFRRNISHAQDPLTAAAIQAGSGLLQSITSIIGSAQQRKAADQAYRDVLRMSNQSADRQRGQLGLGAAAGILGTLSQDPTVNAAYLNPTYINQMQTRTPSQITDSIANSAFANMPTFSNLAPQQQMLASQAAWGQALKAAGDARMNAWAGDRAAKNQQLQSLQQYYDTNENNRVAAQNATRLNRNQQIGNVGDRTQGYFDSTATIEANLGQTQTNARLGQGAAQQQAIRSYTQGINQAIGTAGAAAYDLYANKKPVVNPVMYAPTPINSTPTSPNPNNHNLNSSGQFNTGCFWNGIAWINKLTGGPC